MQRITEELKRLVQEFVAIIGAIPEAEFSCKPAPGKWSKKEILGHLVDSAHNNHRRFICGQYEPAPPHIAYDQDFWVEANEYESMAKEDLVRLWTLMNERICRVLSSMPESNYGNVCDISNTAQKFRTLAWLAEDYLRHLKHHLNQIAPGSFTVEYKSDI